MVVDLPITMMFFFLRGYVSFVEGMWGCPSMGVSKHIWLIMENPNKKDDLGVPWGTPILGNPICKWGFPQMELPLNHPL